MGALLTKFVAFAGALAILIYTSSYFNTECINNIPQSAANIAALRAHIDTTVIPNSIPASDPACICDACATCEVCDTCDTCDTCETCEVCEICESCKKCEADDICTPCEECKTCATHPDKQDSSHRFGTWVANLPDPVMMYNRNETSNFDTTYPMPPTTSLDVLVSSTSKMQQDDVISFFGDSITFLDGYLTVMRNALAASEFTKDRNVQLINRGYNGATIQDLIRGGVAYNVTSLPYEEGLKIDNPTIVVIYVGVNDIGLHGDYAEGHDCSNATQYRDLLHGMVDTARRLTGAQVVLSTVSVYGEKAMFDNYYDRDLNEFAKAVYVTSVEKQTSFVDLRGAHFRYYKQYNSKDPVEAGVLTRSDSVHPSPQGQVLIANEMAKGIHDAISYRDR